MTRYMEHDLYKVSGAPEYVDDGSTYECRRCGARVRYFTWNLPCGSKDSELWWGRDGKIAKYEPTCVERDVAKG